jgi:hypothetical protein
MDYVRCAEKDQVIKMFQSLIAAQIIIEENMLYRMIYLKNSCIDNVHAVYESKKILFGQIYLDIDCRLEII